MPKAYECLEKTRDGNIVHIRLNRPALRNRFDETLHTEFVDALADLPEDANVAALVLSAEGDAFSAGGDLDMMLRANESKEMRLRLEVEGLAIVRRMLAVPYPVIAALQGHAIGLGATIVSLCDMVVAAKTVRIGDPHVAVGLVAGDGGIIGWSQAVGIMRAKRYLLTGDAIDAQTAWQIGLVTDLVETPDEALPAAMALAERICELPRGGVRGTKRAFNSMTSDLYMSAFELAFAIEMETLGGEELASAVTNAKRALQQRK